MNNKTTMEYIAAVEAGNFPDDPRVPLDHKFEVAELSRTYYIRR